MTCVFYEHLKIAIARAPMSCNGALIVGMGSVTTSILALVRNSDVYISVTSIRQDLAIERQFDGLISYHRGSHALHPTAPHDTVIKLPGK